MGEILFIAHRIPYPPDRGDKIRSWNIVRRLADLAPVHIAAFADDERDMGFAADLERISASTVIVPRDISRPRAALQGLLHGRPLSIALFDDPRLRAHIARLLAERPISAVFVYSGQMAQYVAGLSPDVRFIMDFCDLDSAKFAGFGAAQMGPMGWINRREGRRLLAFEKETARRADVSLFVSEAEAALFQEKADLDPGRVRVLENGVDLDYFNPAADFAPLPPEERGKGPLLVFTGQMDYRPNVEAVDYFARHSLPLVRQRHPDARFAIVGRRPTAAVQALARLPGVIVTGSVPDVRGWLAAADIVVAPLRLARGIQNKVLEAMAMARPVVASMQAAEGIDAVDGSHFRVANDSDEEARMVLLLLNSPAEAVELGKAARRRVEERYSWRAALAPLSGIVDMPHTGDRRRIRVA